MNRENPTDYDLGLCDAKGHYFPDARECMNCTHIGADGLPDPNEDKCLFCSRNEDRTPHEDDEDKLMDNFDECGEDEPRERFYEDDN